MGESLTNDEAFHELLWMKYGDDYKSVMAGKEDWVRKPCGSVIYERQDFDKIFDFKKVFQYFEFNFAQINGAEISV